MIYPIGFLDDGAAGLYGWMLAYSPPALGVLYRRGHGLTTAGMIHGLS